MIVSVEFLVALFTMIRLNFEDIVFSLLSGGFRLVAAPRARVTDFRILSFYSSIPKYLCRIVSIKLDYDLF